MRARLTRPAAEPVLRTNFCSAARSDFLTYNALHFAGIHHHTHYEHVCHLLYVRCTSGANVRSQRVSQHALTTVVAMPGGDVAAALDYMGGIAFVALRPTEQSLAPRKLPAYGRIRAIHWDHAKGELSGVDETGIRFAITRCDSDWEVRSLPSAPSPTGDCTFLPDGRLLSVEAVLSNNKIYLNERDGGPPRLVWPGMFAPEEFLTLTKLAITPDGANGAFAVRRPGVGGSIVCLFGMVPWIELTRVEFRDHEVIEIAQSNGSRRVLFGFQKMMEPPVLWTQEGMLKLPIDGGVKRETYEAGDHRSLRSFSISADGQRYLVIDRHGDLWQFDHANDDSPAHRRIGAGKFACDLSPDGKIAAVLSGERVIEVLQLGFSGKPRRFCELIAPWKIEVFQLTRDHPILLLGGRAAICAYSFPTQLSAIP